MSRCPTDAQAPCPDPYPDCCPAAPAGSVTTLYVFDQTEAPTMGSAVAVIKLGILQQVSAQTEAITIVSQRLRRRLHRLPSMDLNTHVVAAVGEDLPWTCRLGPSTSSPPKTRPDRGRLPSTGDAGLARLTTNAFSLEGCERRGSLGHWLHLRQHRRNRFPPARTQSPIRTSSPLVNPRSAAG